MKKKIFIIGTLILLLFSCKGEKKHTVSQPVFGNFQYASILELQSQLHTIAKNETPSVVSISTEKVVSQSYGSFDPFDFFFRAPWDNEGRNKTPRKKEYKQGGLGSGVIYKNKGNEYYVITNNHVIDGVDSIKVIIDQEKSYKATLIATDPAVDIAVVKIKTKDDLQVAKFGNSDNLNAGDFVIAIGNPFGLQGTMTFGIISALGRGDISTGQLNLTNFIQTDAAINPGNSGGPLINLDGEVIGINTLIYSQSGGNIGIGFAIPVNIAKKIADQIIEKGKVEHGYLGIEFEELNSEKIETLKLNKIKGGMHVLKVFEGSPADKSGIKAGDVLLELNGKKLSKSNDLTLVIGNSTPGTVVKIKLLRNNKNLELDVRLGDRNEMKKISKTDSSEIIEAYGIKLTNLNESLRREYNVPPKLNGAMIVEIDPRGIAGQSGLEQGDVIYKINNITIENIDDVKKIVKDNQNESYFFISRSGKEFIIKM